MQKISSPRWRATRKLQSQLSAATTSEEAKKVVTDAGYGDVSSADAQSVLAAKSDSGELSEEQLGAAAGAGGFGLGLPGVNIGINW